MSERAQLRSITIKDHIMKSALLLIDLQNDYFPGGAMELAGMTRAAAHAAEALAAFRQAGRPRFHVQHIALGPGAPFFRPDTPGVEIHASVRPRPNEPVIRKHYPDRKSTRLNSSHGYISYAVFC